MADFPKKKDLFVIRQHRTLEEFEADWDSFCEEYSYETKYDEKTNRPYADVSGVEKRVHAIIIDEGEFLYRDGYINRHETSIVERGITFKPKDYGIPRKWFMIQMNRMTMLPCHFIITSKVGFEYESFRATKSDGNPGSLQFRKTGEDKYRLPDQFLYIPSFSMHLFCHEKPKMVDAGGEEQVPVYDEIGRQIMTEEFWGEARKQKADRSKQFMIRDPTITKIMIKLKAMKLQVEIQ